jgi:hypothetical protein
MKKSPNQNKSTKDEQIDSLNINRLNKDHTIKNNGKFTKDEV